MTPKKSTDPDPEEMLPLSPAIFHILLALADKDRHGYGIMQEVRIRTEEQVQLGPGTLYGAVKRLLEKGVIEELDERPDPELDDERRRYYHLSDFGQRVLRAEVERLTRLVQQAQAKQFLPGTSQALLAGGS